MELTELKFGCGVRTLYRYYRQRKHCIHPAHEALLLARYHEGKPQPLESSPAVRALYRHYRQAHRFSPPDALRVARCHAQGRSLTRA